MKLIYVGDPMCSWCYGFGKELSALVAHVPDLNLEIVVGGSRAGATDILDAPASVSGCSTGSARRTVPWPRHKSECRSRQELP